MNAPRILTLDIETVPALVYVFSLRNQNYISIDQIKEHDRMVCYAAKWLGEPKVAFSSEYHHDRETMAHSAFSLLDEADALVTWNGDGFDIPWLNRTFKEHGLGLPSSYVSIDMLKPARKNLKYLSHKLAYITEQFELTGKLQHTGFKMWRDVLGDYGEDAQRKAWSLMRRYNKQDVVTTEEAYLELLPYLNKHPNLNFFTEVEGCPKCGSQNLEKRGFKYTSVSVFRQLHCRSCGSWSRSGKREKGVDLR